MTPLSGTKYNGPDQPKSEEPTRGKESRMARKKRPYGSGCLIQKGTGWALRWREIEIAPDGTRQKVLRFKNLGSVSKREATQRLSELMALAGTNQIQRSRVLFEALAAQWEATVLPMYKHSTRKNHTHILHKHLVPRFGKTGVSAITRQDVQKYVAELAIAGYAPKSIDHIHDVLSAILRTAMKWGHLRENPARGVDLPSLKPVRPRWVLTPAQAADLLNHLSSFPKTIVGVALMTGFRRGEVFALRWKSFDERNRTLTVSEAVYEGAFGSPKTEAGNRRIPLSEFTANLLIHWKARAKRIGENDLIFCTRSGKPISPNNILRRWVFPACDDLKQPHATWLTFRRTYCSWAHDKGVPEKIVAELIGHSNVRTTLNIYTQVLQDSVKIAVNRIGEELFTIVHSGERAKELTS
jgi:integrase